MNDNITNSRGIRAGDVGGLVCSHRAAVLATDRVRLLVDRTSFGRVVVRQPDHKVVQTTLRVLSQTQCSVRVDEGRGGETSCYS